MSLSPTPMTTIPTIPPNTERCRVTHMGMRCIRKRGHVSRDYTPHRDITGKEF